MTQAKIPAVFMRGGTSRAIFFRREDLPADLERQDRVFLADGHRFMNRPGPRLVESLQILCEMLHPDAFEPRWRGDAWEPL